MCVEAKHGDNENQLHRVTDYLERCRDWMWYEMMKRYAEGVNELTPPADMTEMLDTLVSEHKQQNHQLREELEYAIEVLKNPKAFQISHVMQELDKSFRQTAVVAELRNLGYDNYPVQWREDGKPKKRWMWFWKEEFETNPEACRAHALMWCKNVKSARPLSRTRATYRTSGEADSSLADLDE